MRLTSGLNLGEEYRKNVKTLGGLNGDEGFTLACEGCAARSFDNYFEAARKARELDTGEALIMMLSREGVLKRWR